MTIRLSDRVAEQEFLRSTLALLRKFKVGRDKVVFVDDSQAFGLSRQATITLFLNKEEVNICLNFKQWSHPAYDEADRRTHDVHHWYFEVSALGFTYLEQSDTYQTEWKVIIDIKKEIEIICLSNNQQILTPQQKLDQRQMVKEAFQGVLDD